MSIEVKQKLYTILAGDGTLAGLIGGASGDTKIYPELPDQPETFDCIVYGIEDAGFRTVPRGAKDLVINIRIYSKQSIDHVEEIADRVLDLLNYFTDNGNIIVYSKQIGEVDLNEKDRQLFSKLVRYAIWSIKS